MQNKYLIGFVLLLILCLGVGYNYGISRSETLSQNVVSTANYVVFKDGLSYYAQNGFTGAIDYKGADASSVIQSAISALKGGSIFIKRLADPMDAYVCSTKLVLKSGIWLLSDGARLRFTNVRQNGIEAIGTADNFLSDIVIDGLKIEGYAVTAPHNKDGIHFENVVSYGLGLSAPYRYQAIVAIRNVWVSDFDNFQINLTNCFGGNVVVQNSYLAGDEKGNGIWVENCNGITISNVEINEFKDNGYGLWIQGGESVNVQSVIAECSVVSNQTGFYITGGLGPVTLSECYTEVIQRGVYVDNPKENETYNVNIVDSFINAINPIWFNRNVSGGSIKHNTLVAKEYNYQIYDSCEDIDVEGNQFIGSSNSYYDVGRKSENSGVATISASLNVSFKHGLIGTPTGVWASFNSTSILSWTWTANSTHITIIVAPKGSYTTFWKAEYKP